MNKVDFDVIFNDEENIVVVRNIGIGMMMGDHLETQRSDEPAKT